MCRKDMEYSNKEYEKEACALAYIASIIKKDKKYKKVYKKLSESINLSKEEMNAAMNSLPGQGLLEVDYIDINGNGRSVCLLPGESMRITRSGYRLLDDAKKDLSLLSPDNVNKIIWVLIGAVLSYVIEHLHEWLF